MTGDKEEEGGGVNAEMALMCRIIATSVTPSEVCAGLTDGVHSTHTSGGILHLAALSRFFFFFFFS